MEKNSQTSAAEMGRCLVCLWMVAIMYDFFFGKPLGGGFAHCFAVHFFLLIAAIFFTKSQRVKHMKYFYREDECPLGKLFSEPQT